MWKVDFRQCFVAATMDCLCTIERWQWEDTWLSLQTRSVLNNEMWLQTIRHTSDAHTCLQYLHHIYVHYHCRYAWKHIRMYVHTRAWTSSIHTNTQVQIALDTNTCLLWIHYIQSLTSTHIRIDEVIHNLVEAHMAKLHWWEAAGVYWGSHTGGVASSTGHLTRWSLSLVLYIFVTLHSCSLYWID